MKPIVRPGNNIPPRPRRLFARGVFYTLVPLGSAVVSALVIGLVISGVTA